MTNRDRLTVNPSGAWRLYWGNGPIPTGAEAAGTIKSTDDAGALIRLASGAYVQGNAGAIKQLPQHKIMAALEAIRAQ